MESWYIFIIVLYDNFCNKSFGFLDIDQINRSIKSLYIRDKFLHSIQNINRYWSLNYFVFSIWTLNFFNFHYRYILKNESGRAGQLRIDKVDEMGEISYMVAPDKRNRGFGKRIVELAESVVTQDMKALIGLVENQNEFSKKCFRVNNYSEFSGGQVTFFVKIL